MIRCSCRHIGSTRSRITGMLGAAAIARIGRRRGRAAPRQRAALPCRRASSPIRCDDRRRRRDRAPTQSCAPARMARERRRDRAVVGQHQHQRTGRGARQPPIRSSARVGEIGEARRGRRPRRRRRGLRSSSSAGRPAVELDHDRRDAQTRPPAASASSAPERSVASISSSRAGAAADDARLRHGVGLAQPRTQPLDC